MKKGILIGSILGVLVTVGVMFWLSQYGSVETSQEFSKIIHTNPQNLEKEGRYEEVEQPRISTASREKSEYRYSYTDEIDLNAANSKWPDEYGCSGETLVNGGEIPYAMLGSVGETVSGCKYGMLTARSVEEAKWMQNHLFPNLSFYESLSELDISDFENQAEKGNAEAAIALAFKYRDLGDLETAIKWANMSAKIAPRAAFPQILQADSNLLQADLLYNEATALSNNDPQRDALIDMSMAYYSAAITYMSNAALMGDVLSTVNLTHFLDSRRFDPYLSFSSLVPSAMMASFSMMGEQCLVDPNNDLRPVTGPLSP